MKHLAALAVLALTGCATTAAQMMSGQPHRSYVSAKPHAEIAQCIAATVPGASVIPGAGGSIVNVQNPDGPILLTWRIAATATGSGIAVWRANSLAPGVGAAERCF